jgi:glycosyltransferase involved in cell wall biosynthesis
MRIVYLGNAPVASPLASSIQTMRMCEALARRGHDVTLLTIAGNDVADVHAHYGVAPIFTIRKVPRWNSPLWAAQFAVYAADFLRRERSQIDLCYGRSAHGLRAAAWLRIPFVYEVHAPPASRQRALLDGSLVRSRMLRRLVFITAALRDEYLKRFRGIGRSADALVAHDSADPNAATRAPQMTMPGRSGVLRAGYIGHMYPGKGAEVVARLAAVTPDWDFHIVGGKAADLPDANAATLPNLFLHGFVPPSQVTSFQNAMDVLLLPAQYRVAVNGGGDVAAWMSPLKLFEYMAAGKAIIASDLPVLREVLRDHRNCVLANPSDLAAWQSALDALKRDATLRAELGRTARQEVERLYSWDRRAERVLAGIETERVS